MGLHSRFLPKEDLRHENYAEHGEAHPGQQFSLSGTGERRLENQVGIWADGVVYAKLQFSQWNTHAVQYRLHCRPCCGYMQFPEFQYVTLIPVSIVPCRSSMVLSSLRLTLLRKAGLRPFPAGLVSERHLSGELLCVRLLDAGRDDCGAPRYQSSHRGWKFI